MNLKKYISLIAFLLCFVSHAQERQQKVAQQAMITAVQLYEEGKLQDAFALLKQAEALDPQNDAVHYYLGTVAGKAGEVELAKHHYSQAYKLDSANVWYAQQMATVYNVFHESDKAVGILERILKKRPYDLNVMSTLIDSYIMSGEHGKADSLLTKVETINGDNDYTRLTHVEILRQKGDFTAFFAALKDFFRTADMEGADKTDLIDKVLKSSDPRFNFVHLKDYEELADVCLEVHPTDTAVNHYAAKLYYTVDKKEKALDLCKQWPKDTLMLRIAMSIHYTDDNYKEVVQHADKLLDLCRDDRQMQLSMHTVKGDCYHSMGNNDKAAKEYELALKLDPENANVLNNYAYMLVCEGKNIGKAAKMSRKAVEKEPDNASYLDTYAWIMHTQKKYQVAKAYFKKALLYGGKDSAVMLEHYAETLDALGETTLAKAYREQAALKKANGKK